MADLRAQLETGLASRYTIERELGRGGMATVYLAQDLRHDRPVALKVLHPELAAALGPERFLAEIRTTASLQHPGILPLHDSGSGTSEVYVRPFPNVDSARFAISSGGGIEPLWRRDGRELFHRTVRGDVFATETRAGRDFRHGAPTRLVSRPDMAFQQFYRTWDIHPDGRRFLMLKTAGATAQSFSIVFNWQHGAEPPAGRAE